MVALAFGVGRFMLFDFVDAHTERDEFFGIPPGPLLARRAYRPEGRPCQAGGSYPLSVIGYLG